MGFFDTGFPERVRGKRTQRPRPVVYFNPKTQRPEMHQTLGYYWEEIGLRQDIAEPQGMLPSGNNLYSILQRDILTPNVTLQMYGLLGEQLPGFPEVSPGFQDAIDNEEEQWFSRTVSRRDALDTLTPLARGGDHRLFLHELSLLTGHNILSVETIRVIPADYVRYE